MFAERMQRLGTETAFEVMARAKKLERQGREIVHLEIGEPDFDTPSWVCDAAVEALRDGYTHYVPSAGLPELREVIAQKISESRGIEVGPENVVVTPGAKPVLLFAVLACVNEGDEVIYPDPGYPIYESLASFIGARPVPMPLHEERGFRFDLDEFASLVNDRTRMVILNSPHNPTGGMLTRQDLEQVANIVRDRDITVVSDEVYSRILYEGEHTTIASMPGMQDKTVIVDGHSKTYAMTGWRLGYGVMNKELCAKMTRLMTNSASCTNAFVQRAGITALAGPQQIIQERTEEFRRRRDVLVEGLNRIPGVSCFKPKGAFYAFPNVKEITNDSQTLADRILDEAGVALLSGTSFGPMGQGYLRFSFANSIENLNTALERISGFLAGKTVYNRK